MVAFPVSYPRQLAKRESSIGGSLGRRVIENDEVNDGGSDSTMCESTPDGAFQGGDRPIGNSEDVSLCSDTSSCCIDVDTVEEDETTALGGATGRSAKIIYIRDRLILYCSLNTDRYIAAIYILSSA